MSPDLRSFNYSLEPVLARHRWSLDALNLRLGNLQKRIGVATEALSNLDNEYRARSRGLTASLGRAIDPASYRLNMGWLVQLQGRLATAHHELARLQEERQKLVATCNAQRQKVEAIEAHRDESVVAFAQVESARLATAADREWLARGRVTETSTSAPPRGQAS